MAEELIANYLKTHHLVKTLKAFQLETNRKYGDELVEESLDVIINDYVGFKKLKEKNRDEVKSSNNTLSTQAYTAEQLQLISNRDISIPRWTISCPKCCQPIDILGQSLVIFSRFDHTTLGRTERNVGIFTTSHHSLCIYDLDDGIELIKATRPVPTKAAMCVPGTDLLLSFGMNGSFAIEEMSIENGGRFKPLGHIKLHKRLITAADFVQTDKNTGYTCSLGWDKRIVVCKVDYATKPKVNIIGEKTLPTEGTCIQILIDHKSHRPVFLVGRTDCTLLDMYTVVDVDQSEKLVKIAKLSLNDSEFSSHIFHPMTMTQVGNNMVCVGTSHVPYMRLVTIVIPSINEVLKNPSDLSNRLQQLSLNEQNVPIIRSLIVSNFNSTTAQDKFSTPILLDRPAKRNGLWILGDDGTIRGFDFNSGKVVEELKAHKGRIKTAFVATTRENEELVVSCGAADRMISLWK